MDGAVLIEWELGQRAAGNPGQVGGKVDERARGGGVETAQQTPGFRWLVRRRPTGDQQRGLDVQGLGAVVEDSEVEPDSVGGDGDRQAEIGLDGALGIGGKAAQGLGHVRAGEVQCLGQ
jgi:hypothetical protein